MKKVCLVKITNFPPNGSFWGLIIGDGSGFKDLQARIGVPQNQDVETKGVFNGSFHLPTREALAKAARAEIVAETDIPLGLGGSAVCRVSSWSQAGGCENLVTTHCVWEEDLDCLTLEGGCSNFVEGGWRIPPQEGRFVHDWANRMVCEHRRVPNTSLQATFSLKPADSCQWSIVLDDTPLTSNQGQQTFTRLGD